jgi:aminopeptidase N
VAVGVGDEVQSFDVALADRVVDVPAAVGLPAPDWVLPADGGRGYGLFAVDPVTLAFLVRGAHTIADPVRRGTAFVTLWENMLEGRAGAGVVRDALVEALRAEHVELNLQLLLEYTRALFWRFTPASERSMLAARIEPVLREGLARASTTSAKAAWFSALRSMAITPSTLGWLESVWARRVRIAGLPLAEVDESDLALELAVRDVPSAEAILTGQLDRITNADRKARFQFIMPALARSADARRRFFESLRDVKNRSREAWVLDAVRYLHHPLRADASAPLVRPALDLVLEIQRTGDIFFPKRWADATLSGYQSPEVASDVRQFIEGLPPDYPPRLEWVLLASADPLFRAAKALASESRSSISP